MKRIFLMLFVFNSPCFAGAVIPNFQQGVLQNHTETSSVVVENIKSFDFRNGYQLTTGGMNISPSTNNVAPTGHTTNTQTVQGVNTTVTTPSYTTRPTYNIVDEGASWNYFETLETGGLTNFTEINRTTTIESISDSTSTFSQ
tara:strand:- start:965 stop:1393 length:429 start_codon:yes stop_codon:yes gene_type:complete